MGTCFLVLILLSRKVRILVLFDKHYLCEQRIQKLWQ